MRERATTAREFDPAEIRHGHHSDATPPITLAALPLIIVVGVNFLMSFVVLPRLDTSFLAEQRWGATSLSNVAGVWAVVVALAAATLTLVLVNGRRLPALRESMDAGANASGVNSGPKLAENQRFEIAARPHLAVDLLMANLSGTPCPVKAAAAEGGGQRPAFTGHGVPPNLATGIDA